MVVGDWTRVAAPGNNGRVTYSLLTSTSAVIELIVKLDGVQQDRLTGSDLRKVAGSYFQLPLRRGSYALTVEAKDGICTDGSARPMTVVVQ